MKKKMILKIFMTIFILGIVIKVISLGYYYYTKSYPLSGTIVVPKIETIELINPNDFRNSVVIDLKPYIEQKNRYLLTPVVEEDGIYFLGIGRTKKDKSTPYTIIRLSNNGYETLPIIIDNTHRESWGGLLYITPSSFYIIDGSQVFEINKENRNVKRIQAGLQRHKSPLSYQRNTPILIYRNGIIGTNEQNDVIYVHDGKIEKLFSMPFLLFKGWYQEGKSFLAYDYEREESVVLDLQGRKLFVFGKQPYDVLGTHKDGLLLMMMPQGEGGTSPFDIELSWNNLFDNNIRMPFVPFIYDYRTKNTILVRRNISLVTNQWQKISYNKFKYEKYKEAAKKSYGSGKNIVINQ